MNETRQNASLKAPFYRHQKTEENFRKRKFLLVTLNSVLILAAASFVVLYGIMGFGRPHGPQDVPLYDFIYFYSAGKGWLAGVNPYAPSFELLFAYPPNSAFFCILMSLTDLETAQNLFLLLNTACIAIFAYLCFQLYDLRQDKKQFFLLDFKASLLISMVIGNIYVANILWVGQTSLIFATALLASYYYHIRSYDMRSGVLLAVALIKPQLACIFLLWIILEKRWKTIAAAIVTTGFLSIVPLYQRGFINSIYDWVNVLGKYVIEENSKSFWNLFGIQPLLSDFGVQIDGSIVFACAIPLLVWLHRHYSKKDDLKMIGVLSFIVLLFGLSHQYDLILAASILPYCFIRLDVSKKDLGKWLLFSLSFCILNFPRKMLLPLEVRILSHHRVIVLIILIIVLMAIRDEDTQRTPS